MAHRLPRVQRQSSVRLKRSAPSLRLPVPGVAGLVGQRTRALVDSRISGPAADPVAVVVHTLVVLSTMSMSAILPLLPILHRALDLSAFGLSVLVALPSLTMIVFAVPAGRVCDRWGPRRITFAGAALFTVSCFVQVEAQLVPFVLGRLLFGVALTVIWTGAPAWLRQSRPGSSGRVGAIVTSGAAGSIAGPVFAGLLADQVGFAATFIALGVLGAIATVPFSLRRRPRESAAQTPSQPWFGLAVQAAHSPELVAALAAMLAVGAASGALQLLLPLALHRAGASVSTIGVAFSAAGCLYMVASSLTARARPATVTAGSVVIGCFVMAALVAPVGISSAGLWVAVCLVGFTVPRAQLNTVSYRLAAICDLARSNNLGMVVGLLNLVWAIAMVAGPIGAAWLDQGLGHGSAFLGTACWPALVGTALAAVLYRRRRRAHANPPMQGTAEAPMGI